MCLHQADGRDRGGAQGSRDRRSLHLEPCPADEGGFPGLSLLPQGPFPTSMGLTGDLIHAERRSSCSGQRTSLCQIKPQPQLERVGLPHAALHTPEEAGGVQVTECPAPDTEREARPPTAPGSPGHERCVGGGSGARSVGVCATLKAASRTRMAPGQRLFQASRASCCAAHAAWRLGKCRQHQ